MEYSDSLIDLESDQECESSDDDIEIMFTGTPDQQQRFERKLDRDQFEKDMEDELNATVSTVFDELIDVAGSAKKEAEVAAVSGTSVHDDKVVTSDVQPSNDDLLYDPEIDDQNERWMDEQRRGYQVADQPPRKSDAVLDCPGCMTTLCLDCQRHEVYNNQYRAMFAMNCDVVETEVLDYPAHSKKQRKKRKTDAQPPEQYHPVRCRECSTEVGVFDKDEVFHFFNVLASHA